MALPGNGVLALSERALERVVAHFEIGDPHTVLRPTPVWLDDEEQAAENRALQPEIAALPIYEGPGRLDRDVVDSLRCLCRPEVAYAAMTHINGELRNLLVCSLGREALLADRRNGRISLHQISPSGLETALVRALPEYPPARFAPFSVPFAGEEESSAGVMVRVGNRPDERIRRLWDELVAHRQYGGGQVMLELRDAMGRFARSTEPVVFVDAEIGRWSRSTEHRGAHRYVFCAPLPREEFGRKLHSMREALQH